MLENVWTGRELTKAANKQRLMMTKRYFYWGYFYFSFSNIRFICYTQLQVSRFSILALPQNAPVKKLPNLESLKQAVKGQSQLFLEHKDQTNIKVHSIEQWLRFNFDLQYQFVSEKAMSRRELPARSSRGQKPQLSQKEIQENNAFYQAVFGTAAAMESQQQEDNKKQEARQARKQQFAQNIPNYTYSRAHHYFFDLDTFPRVEGHPSYAVDLNNAFGWHYSQQEKTYKGTPLSKIINRRYFGLPHTNMRESEEDRSKNPIHSVLFQGEDKKYNLQRTIYTCNKVSQRLQKQVQTGNIKKYRLIVKRQPELEKLANQKVPLQLKKEILSKILQRLREKKQMSQQNHQYEDKMHFHFSLDQAFHNKVSQIHQKVSLSLIPLTIYQHQIAYSTTIKQNPQALAATLKDLLKFHLTSSPAVSDSKIQWLVKNYNPLLLAQKQDNPLINLPCEIYNFGPQNLLTVVNNIISTKISKVQGDIGYYSAKFAWSKFFKADLIQFKALPKFSFPQYRSKIQALVQNIKNHLAKATAPDFCENQCIFDDKLNLEGLSVHNQQQTLLIKKTNPISINERQLLIITLYSFLCKSLSKLYTILEQTPDYANLFTSQYFNKHCHLPILQVTKDPYFGVFIDALELIVEYIVKPSELFNIKVHLQFDYDSQNRLGIIWKTLAKDEAEWESVEEQDEAEEVQNLDEDGQQQDLGNTLKKKIKEDPPEEI